MYKNYWIERAIEKRYWRYLFKNGHVLGHDGENLIIEIDGETYYMNEKKVMDAYQRFGLYVKS